MIQEVSDKQLRNRFEGIIEEVLSRNKEEGMIMVEKMIEMTDQKIIKGREIATLANILLQRIEDLEDYQR